jgi:hypothetical protein
MDVDPQLCRKTGWFDYKLEEDSLCAAENCPDCGLVGSQQVGCVDSPVTSRSWGALKALFR